jgi:hypothetical protein
MQDSANLSSIPQHLMLVLLSTFPLMPLTMQKPSPLSTSGVKFYAPNSANQIMTSSHLMVQATLKELSLDSTKSVGLVQMLRERTENYGMKSLR